MKNPLIDALRQAASDEHPDLASDDTASSVELNEANPPDIETGKLDLLESETSRSDGLQIARDVQVPDAPDFPDHDATQTSAAEEGANLSTTAMLHASGASLRHRDPAIVVIARYCPWLCVIAVVISAGSHYLYNNLAVANLNGDLVEMSEKLRMESIDGPEDSAGPINAVSAFDQLTYGESAGVTPAPPANEVVPDVDGNNGSSSTDKTPATELPYADNEFEDLAYEYILSGYTANSNKQYAVAEEQYRHALAIEPNHRDALIGIATLFQQTGRIDEALLAYEKLLASEPDNAVAAAAIITLRSDTANGNIESELKHLLQRYPDAHQFHYSLGQFYIDQNRWADAKLKFLAAHRLAPGRADYSYNAAVCMERLGEPEAARRYFSLALDSMSDASSIDRNLVVAHISVLDSQLERL